MADSLGPPSPSSADRQTRPSLNRLPRPDPRMGRTVPSANQAIRATVRELRVIRDGLTTKDKKLWDEFMATAHLNERAISFAVFYDPFDAMVLGMLFAQFKMIKRLGGTVSEWYDSTLDGATAPEGGQVGDAVKPEAGPASP